MENGADVHIKNEAGKTALDYAEKRGVYVNGVLKRPDAYELIRKKSLPESEVEKLKYFDVILALFFVTSLILWFYFKKRKKEP